MIHTLMRLIRWVTRWVWTWIGQLIHKRTGAVITLDTGRRVIVGKQIAEGGFSFVFEATAAMDDSQRDGSGKYTKYALKRIHCPDPDLLQKCRDEAAVHRAVRHPNLMPLLGFTTAQQTADCYMLFPFCQQSLRDAVNRRNPLITGAAATPTKTAPWPEATALNLFLRICAGVQALHEHGYTHRDVKLENVLLLESPGSSSSSSSASMQPVLMDFGSAGPLRRQIRSRRDVLDVVDEAAQHTTLPYRPPELFEGGVRVGDALDYRAVDVWSLACTLHAVLYGVSPFECEFHHLRGIRVVECTHLSVLGGPPAPKPPIDTWYSPDIRTQLLEPMLTQDPHRRPTLPEVIAVTEGLIEKQGGRVDRGSREQSNFEDVDLEEDGIALMSRVV